MTLLHYFAQRSASTASIGLFESVDRLENKRPSYPPYNIEKTGEDGYRVIMAVAGFAESDLDITQHQNTLVIKGSAPGKDEGVAYLHQGIAQRAFERRFELADYVNVSGAVIVNGLLYVDLARELPEEAKPRSIAITAANAATAIGDKAAA